MAYDKDRDYQAEINAAAAKKDYKTAASLEQSRNEKIKSEGLGYATTSNYKGWLDDTDYSTKLNQQMTGGASAAEVQATLGQRQSKAYGTVGMEAYRDDDVNRRALSYIQSQQPMEEFSYENAPQYVNRYGSQIDALAKQILGSNYADWTKGQDYAALQDRYTRDGQRAMQDTLGQVAARTGGLASSYAGAAGQQTYNHYMETLEQAAREMYDADYNRQQSNLNMLMALEQGDYGKYADQLGQFNTDRSFGRSVYESDRGYGYQKSRDAIGDARYVDERDYGRGQDARQWDFMFEDRDYNRGLQADALAREEAEFRAKYGDMSGIYNLLGWPAAQSYVPSGGGGSSGGGGKKSSSGGSKSSDDSRTAVNSEDDRGWVAVPNVGRLSYQELESMVNSGLIIEKYDPVAKRYTYRKAK